jgi:hypothetical protein
MRTFFDTLESLHRYTLELDYHQDELLCPNCSKNDQFVSHGFVYRQISSTQQVVVGKRIFCTNRHGKTGCGATHRLYLTEYIPSLRYTTEHVFIFLSALMTRCTIQHAYNSATGTENPRNAYRWLRKLNNKLMAFRSDLSVQASRLVDYCKTQTHRLRLLLPTLQTLFSNLPENPCATYQQRKQIAFI